MSLLNYTTKIEASKTVGEIQALLAKNGAQSVLNEYDNQGYIIAVSFTLTVNDIFMTIKLPSDWRPVLEVLQRDNKIPKGLKTQEQALRVSWRIVLRWVDAQMAILATKIVKIDQIFLPYAVTDNGQTLYERFAVNPQLLLN